MQEPVWTNNNLQTRVGMPVEYQDIEGNYKPETLEAKIVKELHTQQSVLGGSHHFQSPEAQSRITRLAQPFNWQSFGSVQTSLWDGSSAVNGSPRGISSPRMEQSSSRALKAVVSSMAARAPLFVAQEQIEPARIPAHQADAEPQRW